MLHLKQTLHNIYTTISTSISTGVTEFKSLGVVPQNLVLAENLGRLLLSLVLLLSILGFVIANCISSLLSLLKATLQRLRELWTLTEVPGWNVRYILCQWVDAVKNTPSTLKTLLKRVWPKGGDSPQDYTFHSSEMRGALDAKYKNKQHEQAMKAPINKPLDVQLREKGLL